MNLSNIVGGYVAAVNPWVTATLTMSNGYATSADGTRVPAYLTPITVSAQVQSLTYNDLVQISGLNIQGERRAIYLDGDWEGVVRADNKGGDLITLQDGSNWLVAQVLENWSFQDGWVKVCVTRQMP